MRLKKIKLSNIRSYQNQEITFPEGSTLLSGDIGAGKTSILLGVEFALFGLQPGQRGGSILRNGEEKGGVILELEVEGKEIVIERNLKRGKTVSQDSCSITTDGVKEEIAVTELKSRVLDLLSYPREFSKKQNILYKFTVYTPQEEMKEIILQDPASRINTLRHVFGIDKYKKIIENAAIVLTKVREEKRMKQGMIANLERDKENLLSKINELEGKRYNLVSVEKDLFLKKEARNRIEEEKNEIEKKIEEKNRLQSEIEKTKLISSTKNDAILENIKSIEKLELQIKDLKDVSFDETLIANLQKELEEKNNLSSELNEKNLEISSRISSLNLKNSDNDLLRKKISNLDMCPTCLQDVNPVHKGNVSNKLDSEISENIRMIEALSIQKRKIETDLDKVNFETNKIQEKIQEMKILKVRVENINEKLERISLVKKNNLELEKDITLLNTHISSLKNSIFELNKYDTLYEKKKEEFQNSLREERMADIKVAELKKEIDVFSVNIKELEERIKETEYVKSQAIYLSELEDWISTKFVPIVSNIEKNVMVRLKSEFSRLFSEWFSILVPDNFNVQLDDEFTPIIEQNGYDLDYSYLSGGERTAIALAYRLSLNQVINSLLSKIKTKDIVILDEPTDGFSDQQLDKMRLVLEELNANQLIIVSHESKMEGFVQNIIRLKKEGGVTNSSQ